MKRDWCSFAPVGTYGHECGRRAVFAGERPSELTISGTYYARRCEDCQKIEGGENAGITKWHRYNPRVHRNLFK